MPLRSWSRSYKGMRPGLCSVSEKTTLSGNLVNRGNYLAPSLV
jgi:hypothetical protein